MPIAPESGCGKAPCIFRVESGLEIRPGGGDIRNPGVERTQEGLHALAVSFGIDHLPGLLAQVVIGNAHAARAVAQCKHEIVALARCP